MIIFNNIYYSIITYIIIIALLVIIKPEFTYDYQHNKYKEFGVGPSNTLFTIPVIAVCLAIVIGCVYHMTKENPCGKIERKIKKKVKYIPVPVKYRSKSVLRHQNKGIDLSDDYLMANDSNSDSYNGSSSSNGSRSYNEGIIIL